MNQELLHQMQIRQLAYLMLLEDQSQLNSAQACRSSPIAKYSSSCYVTKDSDS
ncbi:hypothetical protein TNCV_3321041, partial [Trichonephila clavipes]